MHLACTIVSCVTGTIRRWEMLILLPSTYQSCPGRQCSLPLLGCILAQQSLQARPVTAPLSVLSGGCFRASGTCMAPFLGGSSGIARQNPLHTGPVPPLTASLEHPTGVGLFFFSVDLRDVRCECTYFPTAAARPFYQPPQKIIFSFLYHDQSRPVRIGLARVTFWMRT